jgi:hypothetical protein
MRHATALALLAMGFAAAAGAARRAQREPVAAPASQQRA